MLRGFSDDKHKQKFATIKLPHCYISIPRKIGGGTANYGRYVKIDPNKYANYGSYGESEMIINATSFSTDPSGTYKIENTWHKLEGIDDPNTTMRLWDAAGNKMNTYDYIIDIYFKLIIPASMSTSQAGEGLLSIYKYVDEIWGNKRYFLTTEYIATKLHGVNQMLTDGESGVNHYLAAGFGHTPDLSIMQLPSDQTLGYDPDFTEGVTLQQFSNNDYWTAYFQRALGPGASSTNKFLGVSEGSNGASQTAMLVDVQYAGTGAVYTIDPSHAGIGIPFNIIQDWHDENKKFYMPELFKGFVMVNNASRISGNQLPDVGALYLCLGVHQKN